MMQSRLILAVFVCFLTWQTVVPDCPNKTCSERCAMDPWQGGKVGNPGAKMIFNDVATNYANQLTNLQFTNIIKNLRAPDVRIGDLTIYGLKVVDFKTPNYHRKLVKPNYVQWGFQQGHLSVQSGFTQIIRRLPLVNRQLSVENITGILTISSDGASLDTSSTMYKDVEGRPTILSMTCSAKLGSFNVSLNGNFSLSSYTQGLIVRQLQSAFEALICTSARTMIMTDVNASLKTFPSKVHLDDNGLILDYGLMENPHVSDDNNAIEGNLKGAVYYRNPTTFPFYPPTISNNVTDNMTMIELYFTSYVVNTLFYTAHQRKLLKFFATSQLLSSSTGQMLRLSCPINGQLCLGSVFRNLSSFSSKSYVNVSMQSSEPPKAMFTPQEAFWLGKGTVNMDIIDESKKSIKLFSGDASCVYGSLNPRLYKNTLFATTNVTYVKLDVVDSPMEKLSNDKLSKLKKIVSVVLEELLNGFLSVGVPIPLVDGVSLVRPKIRMLSGSILVSGNYTFESNATRTG